MQQQRQHVDTAFDAAGEHGGEYQQFTNSKVKDILAAGKRRLVEVPYTATLAQTMSTLVASHLTAVPVAAPPGHWIGAGGSMIMETDKMTGVVRKHYIGMVTMLDVVAHLAGDHDEQLRRGGDIADLEQKMAVPISSVIGHSLEGLSLWTLHPSTSILDCLEVFSKGIHRAMVPVDSHVDDVPGVALAESATSYHMLTQMDVLRFLMDNTRQLHLQLILSGTLQELGAVNENVYSITDRTALIDAIKCLRTALLNAVPIVQSAPHDREDDHKQLINGRWRKIVGTFSATDLRGCHISTLRAWLPLPALEFTEALSKSPPFTAESTVQQGPRGLVSCRGNSTLSEAMVKAVTEHVHRVWIVDEQGSLVGVVALTDMIRVLREKLLLGSPRKQA